MNRTLGPTIVISILLCLASIWNIYMNYYSKNCLSKHSLNINKKDLQPVTLSEESCNEILFSNANNKVHVNKNNTKIKLNT